MSLPLPGLRDPERGIALIIVLVTMALLLTVVAEFSQATRLEGLTALNFLGAITAAHLAEAAYQRALAEILPDALSHELDERGLLVFRRVRLLPQTVPVRTDLSLAAGRMSYRITDEESRLNLNRTTQDTLRRLLSELGVERETRDIIVDSILDWRDANEEYRLNGAETAYYETLTPPYRSKNADFDSVEELLQVRGVTREILYGQAGSPGLAEYLTVAGLGPININTASPVVLRALGFAEAEAALLIAGRPYPDLARLSTQLRRGNQRVRSEHFRIEAVGEVPGQAREALVAVVQRRAGGDGLAHAARLAWRRVPAETVELVSSAPPGAGPGDAAAGSPRDGAAPGTGR